MGRTIVLLEQQSLRSLVNKFVQCTDIAPRWPKALCSSRFATCPSVSRKWLRPKSLRYTPCKMTTEELLGVCSKCLAMLSRQGQHRYKGTICPHVGIQLRIALSRWNVKGYFLPFSIFLLSLAKRRSTKSTILLTSAKWSKTCGVRAVLSYLTA